MMVEDRVIPRVVRVLRQRLLYDILVRKKTPKKTPFVLSLYLSQPLSYIGAPLGTSGPILTCSNFCFFVFLFFYFFVFVFVFIFIVFFFCNAGKKVAPPALTTDEQ